jgi:uncharacterized protein (TIGR02646 family)
MFDGLLRGNYTTTWDSNIGFEDSHVEHFRPQEHFQALQLDYANLHASCIRQTLPGRPLHCGHAKGSDFDNDLAKVFALSFHMFLSGLR